MLGAQVAFANATQQRLRAANALHLATAAYNRWVGQPLDRAPDLEEPPRAAAADTAAPLDQLVAHALERRPELAALSAQQERLEQAARSERAKGLPQVALHAGYNHFDNQILDRENFASVGIGFQWRLFDSGQLQARTSALRSRARAAQQRLADLRSSVALEVETALDNRDEAAARIHAAAAAVAQAEENVRIARELYGSGLGTNNQVLDAETLRVISLTNRDDAGFDLLVAQYRLATRPRRVVGERHPMIRTRIPPPVYALCTAWLIWLLDRYVPSLRWINAPWNELGWGPIAIGLGVDFAAVVSFIRTRTTVNPMRPDRTRHLVTSGLYRLSRNPMYLGLVLSLSGWAWLLGSPIGLIVVWLFARVLIIVQIAPEEAAMRENLVRPILRIRSA